MKAPKRRRVAAVAKEESEKIRSLHIIQSTATIAKELVENSLDSGASEISVKVQWGEKARVCVNDNGCGMSAEDLSELGDHRYLTSKPPSSHTSHGFRGEALHSIAQLCNMEIRTRRVHEDRTLVKRLGVSHPATVAEHTRDSSKSMPCHGTTVLVTNLFAELPVRRSLIRPRVELDRMRSQLLVHSLANHAVSFSLCDMERRQVVWRASAQPNLQARVSEVLGMADTVPFYGRFGELLEVDGLVSLKEFSVPTATTATTTTAAAAERHLFVNGRCVPHSSELFRVLTSVLTLQLTSDGAPLHNNSQRRRYHSRDVKAHLDCCFVLFIRCDPNDCDTLLDPSKEISSLPCQDQLVLLTFHTLQHVSESLTTLSDDMRALLARVVTDVSQSFEASRTLQPSPSKRYPVDDVIDEAEDEDWFRDRRIEERFMCDVTTPLVASPVMEADLCESEETATFSQAFLDGSPMKESMKLSQQGANTAIEEDLDSPSTPPRKMRVARMPQRSGGTDWLALSTRSQSRFKRPPSSTSPHFSSGVSRPAAVTSYHARPMRAEREVKVSRDALRDAVVINQVSKKFIVAIAGDCIMCVDQHAADERVRLERLEALYRSKSSDVWSYATVRASKDVSPVTADRVRSFDGTLARYYGFVYRLTGPRQQPQEAAESTFKLAVSRVPCICGVSLTLDDMLIMLVEFARYDVNAAGVGCLPFIPSPIKRILASKACRSAIMFGDQLSIDQASTVVSQLASCDFPFQCAHGRPSSSVVCDGLKALSSQPAQVAVAASAQSQSDVYRRRASSLTTKRMSIFKKPKKEEEPSPL